MKAVLFAGAVSHVAAVLTSKDDQLAAALATDNALIATHSANAIKSLVQADSQFRNSQFFVDGLKQAQATLEKNLSEEINANNQLQGVEKLLLETKANMEKIADEMSTKIAAQAKADMEKQVSEAETKVRIFHAQ